MEWMFKAGGPSFSSGSVQLHRMLRRLAALACIFCFLFTVISISDHRFSPRKSRHDPNCKILKGCLDSDDESHKAPIFFGFWGTSALSVPRLQAVALVSALAAFPLN